jgi:hypothetical protein
MCLYHQCWITKVLDNLDIYLCHPDDVSIHTYQLALDVNTHQLHINKALDVNTHQLHINKALDVNNYQLHINNALDVNPHQVHIKQGARF